MASDGKNAPEGFAILRTLSNRIDAELIQGLLASRGVDVLVRSDDAGGAYPSLSSVRGVLVMVRDADRERAEEILASAAAESDTDVPAPDPTEPG